MDGDLRIDEFAEGNGEATLCIRGEIDIATAPQLAAALGRLATVTDQAILDFSGVSFMDSSGLKVLMAATHHPDSPMDVRIRNASPDIVRSLRICGLATTLLEGEPTADDQPHGTAGADVKAEGL